MNRFTQITFGARPLSEQWYFAYGSNLKRQRLKDRIGPWENENKAILKNYQLTFAKGWKDHNSGKANVISNPGNEVKGAVYSVTENQLKSLDRWEGVKLRVYRREPITVEINGQSIPAITYVMVKQICPLKPSKEYLGFIIEGLIEHGYNESIINKVRMIANFKEDEQFLGSQETFFQIRKLIDKSTNIKIAIAFLTKQGFDEISNKIEQFLRNNTTKKIDFIVGLSSYCITEPDAIKALIKLQSSFPNQVKTKYYYNEGFHPKLFIFENENETTVIVGSSNLTWQGLNTNVEANVILRRPTASALIISIQDFFKDLMDHADSDLATACRQYCKIYRNSINKQKESSRSSDENFSKTPLPPQFFESKKDIRELLQNCRILWKIAPGNRGHEWSEWNDSSGIGRIAIGWDNISQIGRLNEYKSEEELKRYIDANRDRWGGYWDKIGERGGKRDPSWYVAKQLWRFYYETKIKQIVIAYSNKTIYALGVIDGEYSYIEDQEFYCHRKKVRWIAIPQLRIPLELAKKIGFRQTIYPVKSSATIKEISRLILTK